MTSRREGLNTTDGEVNNVPSGVLRTAIASAIGLAQRTASNAVRYYRDGSLFDSGAPVSTARPNNNISFCANAAGANYSTKRQACGLFGQSLTADQHVSLDAALSAYLAAVGAE